MQTAGVVTHRRDFHLFEMTSARIVKEHIRSAVLRVAPTLVLKWNMRRDK